MHVGIPRQREAAAHAGAAASSGKAGAAMALRSASLSAPITKRSTFPPVCIPFWLSPAFPTKSLSSTMPAPMRRAPWRSRCRTCAWWTSRAKASWSRARRAASRHRRRARLLDADCRAPLTWLERIERRFVADPGLVALSGPYRFYDWDWWGRLLDPRLRLHARAGDAAASSSTCCGSARSSTAATSLSGAQALERIGGFDTSIEFHGEDTNVGRRLFAVGTRVAVPRLLPLHVGASLRRDGQGRGLPALRAQLHVGAAARPPRTRRIWM